VALIIRILLKLGIFPFHYWVLSLANRIRWNDLIVLLTLQKILPIYYLSRINTPEFSTILYLVGSIIGVFSCFLIRSIQKIIIYSSVFSISWVLILIDQNSFLAFFFFFSYSILISTLIKFIDILSVKFTQQMIKKTLTFKKNIIILIVILRVGRFPPRLGFLIKLIAVKEIINLTTPLVYIFSIVFLSLAILRYYLSLGIYFFSWFKSSFLIIPPQKIDLKFLWVMSLNTVAFLIILNICSFVHLFWNQIKEIKFSKLLMSNSVKHTFHLVKESPWPIWMALRTFLLISRSIEIFTSTNFYDFFLRITIIMWISKKWWHDIIMERTYEGCHTPVVKIGLNWGIILFIISEVFFFIRFFWAFFHNRLSPSCNVGIIWPPVGIQTLRTFEVPLLNTIILLRSGASITWAHQRIINSNHRQTFIRLIVTIILGLYFTLLQKIEYDETTFSIADSIYGSTFFLATGFHGLHVIIGSLFLVVCLIRLISFNFRVSHHFGFEAAAWYWHFVDLVWMFLFVSIYWWGGITQY